MSDSVLNRIRQNRNRQEVPTRNDPLVALSPSPETVKSMIVDSANVEIPQINDDLVALSPSPKSVSSTIVDSDNVEIPQINDDLVALSPSPKSVSSTIVDSDNVEIPQINDDLVALSPSPKSVSSTIVDSDNSAKTAISGNTLEELKAELTKFPEMRRHSAIVLERSLDQELTRFCKDQGITVEVFLEAAWTQVTTNPSLKEQIVVEAKRRYTVRKRAGKLRRLITMLGEKS